MRFVRLSLRTRSSLWTNFSDYLFPTFLFPFYLYIAFHMMQRTTYFLVSSRGEGKTSQDWWSFWMDLFPFCFCEARSSLSPDVTYLSFSFLNFDIKTCCIVIIFWKGKKVKKPLNKLFPPMHENLLFKRMLSIDPQQILLQILCIHNQLQYRCQNWKTY